MHPLISIITSNKFKISLQKTLESHLENSIETGFAIVRSTKKGIFYTSVIKGDKTSIDLDSYESKLPLNVIPNDYDDSKLSLVANLHFHPLKKYSDLSKDNHIIPSFTFEQKALFNRLGDLNALHHIATTNENWPINMIASYDIDIKKLEILVFQEKNFPSYGSHDSFLKMLSEIELPLIKIKKRLLKENICFTQGNEMIATILEKTGYYKAQIISYQNGKIEYHKNLTKFRVN